MDSWIAGIWNSFSFLGLLDQRHLAWQRVQALFSKRTVGNLGETRCSELPTLRRPESAAVSAPQGHPLRQQPEVCGAIHC
ncbi:hypothetical protein [Paraburkholderia piptadeniae]|uniref:hypothetical protein n=1 Tax=Paraburkholderia piptadeniae TaxID=1701573 RepID=UPI001180EC3B|nr:hypothetical protein [Paraburkholderia piptadeniae]